MEEVGDLAGDSVLRRTGQIHNVFFTARQKCNIPAGRGLGGGKQEVERERQLLEPLVFQLSSSHREKLILKAVTGVQDNGSESGELGEQAWPQLSF